MSENFSARLGFFGRACVAAAMFGYGIQFILFRETVLKLVPAWPTWLPQSPALIGVLGVFVIIAALSMLLPSTRVVAARILAAMTLFWLCFRHVPLVAMKLHDPIEWGNFAEASAIFAALILVSESGSNAVSSNSSSQTWRLLRLLAPIFFAVPAVIFGIEHFLYADFVATLIPAYFPARVGLAYLVGAALVVAALAIVTGVQRRIASLLFAAMLLVFVLTIHLPRVFAALHNGDEWTSLLNAIAWTGAALLLAQRPNSARAAS